MTKIIYRHYGTDKYCLEDFQCYGSELLSNKPAGGLWGSRADATAGWKGFCIGNQFRTNSLNKYFDFALKNSANVYTISTESDLLRLPMRELPEIISPIVPEIASFIWKYLPDYDKCIEQGIDAVELCWFGVEFSDVAKDPIPRLLPLWDCDSIVVLNQDIVVPL